MKLIISQSQLKNITQKVILEQGAMDDVLNNSPNAPTYNPNLPSYNAGTPPAASTDDGWWSSHPGLMGWINAFKDVYYPSKKNKDIGAVAVKSDAINLFFKDGRWYQYKNENLNDALKGTNNFIASGKWNDNGNALELHDTNGDSWSSSTAIWVKDKTDSNQKQTTSERQKTINNAFCSSVGGMISFQVPGMKNISYSVDLYVKTFNVTPEELASAKASCPNSELSKKMVKQDLNVNCASSLDKIKKGSIKILKYGCKTDAVKELQKLLGMEEKYQTGYFGPITKGKVKEFQTSNGLKVDGIVGSKTYTALQQPKTPTDTSGLGVDDDIDQFNKFNNQQTNEYSNRLTDLDEDEDIAMLDNLFTDNFDTEDDYDGEPLRGDDEGFSNKMRVNQIQKKIKLGDTNMGDTYYHNKDKKKQREFEKRKYTGLDPLRNDDQPEPYNPIKSNDLPLDKYLEKKKMKNLDEDEDIAMLDNLFTKD